MQGRIEPVQWISSHVIQTRSSRRFLPRCSFPSSASDEPQRDLDDSCDAIERPTPFYSALAASCYSSGLSRPVYLMSSRGRVAATAFSGTSVLDWFKPMRNEAIARLRTNSVGLVGLAILSNLLPLPSPWRAIDVVWHGRSTNAPHYYLCAVGACTC